MAKRPEKHAPEMEQFQADLLESVRQMKAGRWRCTDVGSRTICAIKLEGDPSWWSGPPYAVAEHVFDEDDFGALYDSPAAAAL